MSNITAFLEGQRLGSGLYRKKEVAFNDLVGLCDDKLEELDGAPLFVARFCPSFNNKDVIAVASEDGNVIIRNTSYSLTSPLHHKNYHLFRAHNNAIFDLCWSENGANLVTVSGDHSAVLWDINGSGIQHVSCFIGHTRSVRAIAASPTDSNVFATGSRDGSVMIWDSRGPKTTGPLHPDNIIQHCHLPGGIVSNSKGVESITSVTFTDSNTIATCVAGEGTICLWDLRRSYKGGKRKALPKHIFHHPHKQKFKGYSCLTVSPCPLRLYASCIDSTIYSFDIGTFSEKTVHEYKGHYSSSFYIKHSVSPCGSYLVSGSGNNNAYLYRIGEREPVAVMSGHVDEVTSAVWAPFDPLRIATASEDGSYVIWSASPLSSKADPAPVFSCQTLSYAKLTRNPILACRFNCKKDYSDKRKQMMVPSPTKSPIKQLVKRPRLEDSPSKLMFSPTANLPNYVIDGVSPCIRTNSSKKKIREDDWLTKLRKETPPQSKCTSTKKTTPRSSKARGNLLKFFCNQPKRIKLNGSNTKGDGSTCSREAVIN